MKKNKKLKVLYVDDDEDTLELVRFTFGLSDIEVTLTRTADEAWASAHEQKFDIYLLDGMLKAGPSLNLCRDLHKYAPGTPILFYSALAYQSDVANGMNAGAYDYLIKPYFGDLSETIVRSVRDAKAGRAHAAAAIEEYDDVGINDENDWRWSLPSPYAGSCENAIPAI